MSRFGFAILSILFFGCGNDLVLQEVKRIDYPSASAMECRKGLVYVLGDDAPQLLILDSSLHAVDSILLYPGMPSRIPKEIKPDLEAMTFLTERELLVTGSGSLMPARNTGWLIDTRSGKKDSVRLDSFYNRLGLHGIVQLNLEGSALLPGSLLLSNRGNLSYRKNQLIFTSPDFWLRQSEAPINIVLFGYTADSSLFNGVSGLDYAKRSDQLIATVSTEVTRNNTEDGPIGKSYLWIVRNISAKTRWKAVNPDRVIDLTAIDPRLKGQKIESVCVLKETGRFIYLLLSADNDDGSSVLFRLAVPVR